MGINRSATVIASIALVAALSACGDGESVTATFSSPNDGDRVAGGVDVTLAADGITIEEAGEVRDGAGHFHVIADAGCLEPGEAIAKDVDHVHLGKGQSEATVYLAPGRHELCVQVGDGAHEALDVVDTITVDVGTDDLDQWCGVIKEVDDLFMETDSSSDDLPVRQAAYASIDRLLMQLQDGLDLVAADQRDAVGRALEAAATMAQVLTTTDDMAEIEAALTPVYESDPFTPAAPWIQDTCDVSIAE